jgi:hypothetical protein
MLGYTWGEVGDVIIRKIPKEFKKQIFTMAEPGEYVVLKNVTEEIGVVKVSPWENRYYGTHGDMVEHLNSDSIIS